VSDGNDDDVGDTHQASDGNDDDVGDTQQASDQYNTSYRVVSRDVVLPRTMLRPASLAAQCACPPEWKGREGSVYRCR